MSSKELVELLDSILQQELDLSRRPGRVAVPNESFDTQRTLDILINNVLPNLSLQRDQPDILVKVFKTIRLLVQQPSKQKPVLPYNTIVPKFVALLTHLAPDQVIDEIKLTIISIIENVSRTHTYQDISKLAVSLLEHLDTLSNDLFSVAIDLQKLSVSVHLWQILQEFTVNQALLLHRYSFQMDSIARKLWVCLSRIINNPQLLDSLSSTLLLAMFSTYIKDLEQNSSKLSLLCAKINELINWRTLAILPNLQAAISKITLQLLLTASKSNNLVYIKTNIRVQTSLVLANPDNWDQDLIKCLCLVTYCINKEQLSQQMLSKALTTLSNPELEKTRHLVLKSLFDPSITSYLPLSTDEYKLLTLKNSDLPSIVTYISQLSTTKNDPILKLYFINALGTTACIKSGDFDIKLGLCSRCDSQLNDQSYVNSQIDPDRQEAQQDPLIASVLQLLWDIIGQEQEPVLITAGLLALRKIFASYHPPKLTSSDKYFKWISKCLTNDIREIRLLATKLIPYYLILEDDIVYDSNFQLIISMLQQIKINKYPHLAESTIISWSELAIVIGIDEKLILVLVKLIDFIGSEVLFQSTIAFHQLEIISSCKRKTPWQLLSPFLPHLSVIIVKQMKTKPMIINKICGLVRVPIDVFLSRTQLYTIPHLLTYYKHDLIGEISSTIKVSKYELIKQNFPKIIAYLLTLDDKINETKILQILANVNDEFKNRSLQDLIENNISTSWEILKLYSPEFQNEARIKTALVFIASMYSNDEASDSDIILKSYFNRTILGIVQNFSESTYDLKGLQPYIEKLKSIWAIDCLILMSGQSIVAALPQITACLQANLEIKHLHTETLYCLTLLTENLGKQTMLVMLDFILSLILQKWHQFSNRCKSQCKKILRFVLKDNEQLFKQRYYHYFFSFSVNPELLSIYNDATSIFPSSAKSSSYNLLHDLTIRCNHDNKYVVLQALDDLIYYFTKYQDEFHSTYVKLPTFIKYIPKLSSTLLNISYKFKNSDLGVVSRCSRIYGLMGSLDVNRFYLSIDSEHEQLVVINQFQDQNEVYRFLINFIDVTLVPAFWASIDPVKQLFLLYAIQEYMKLLGLNGLSIDTLDRSSTPLIIWNKFSKISQSTLLPLLNSKYSVNGSKDEPLIYPVYKTNAKHSSWLRDLTLDLLKRSRKSIGAHKNSGKIFSICSSIIKDQDLAICNHVLPYVALNGVLMDETINKELSLEISTILETDVDTLKDNSSIESLKSCYQSVFSILEYFQKWSSARKQKRKKQESSLKINELTLKIDTFLSNIPQNLIAKRSSQCKSYERAILNLEESYRANSIDKKELSTMIQSMYVEIDDLDSLDGVLKTFSTQSLNDKLLQFQYSDNWQIAQDSMEALSEFDLGDESLENTTSLMKSLNKFNLYENCLEKLDHKVAVLNEKPIPIEWINLGLNSSVFSGKIEDVQKWIYRFESNIESSSLSDQRILINYEVAKSLICLQSSEFEKATEHIDTAINLLGVSLAASKETSLSKTRDIVNQLHWLTDARQLMSSSTQLKYNTTIHTQDLRLTNTSKDFESNWQILQIRRVLDKTYPREFSKKDISNVWVKLSAIARESSRLDLSTKLIMNSLMLENSREVDLEYAKLLWAQEDHNRALKLINALRLRNSGGSLLNREAAVIQLQFAEWLDLSDSGSSELVISEYTTASKLDAKWEKPYYLLGKYYNKILENQVNNDIKSAKDFYGDYEKGLVFNYLRAVKTGHLYLFEALPKVITIWLDFSSHYNEIPTGYKNDDIASKRSKNFELMKQCIKDVIDSTPKMYWYTVLSQLTSRMIHPNSEIQKIIINLISRITYEYPQQALWSVIAQSKSTLKQRASMGNTILNVVAGYDRNSKTVLKSAMALFDALLNVCMQEVNKKVSEMHLSDDFGFDHQITPCEALVVPLRENFEIKLPSNYETFNRKTSHYTIGSNITIHRIDDRVKILSSMQKPRRLTIKGSDGGVYNILCKPHDDLRKDAKLMEVTTMIDKLLTKDEESELRKLNISTYAVVPLNETYGIIEWVDRCRTMRDIILTYLASTGNPIDFSFCKKQLSDDKNLEEKITGFNNVLAKYPPVFRLWFLEEFPDPKSWYAARNTFTRSCAVMSIVGHILGLGDRHGDNILMMEKTGGVLHVDFDCLFDKGTTLAVPERVPFRLTSNMVDAFGISGVEGIFRKSCEVTMRLIRNNETGLMNILESFLYDPILDWSSSKRRKKDVNHNPESVLDNIKKKIRGIEKDTSLSLSVGANVDILIAQATSEENLAQMYIGWMSFL